VDAAEQLFANILDPKHRRAGADSSDHHVGDAGLPSRGAPHLQRNGNLLRPNGRRDDHRRGQPAGQLHGRGKPPGLPPADGRGYDADDAKKCWFIGDFRKAFAYMENWPITVTQSPPGSEAEFNQDIVVRFKASERGAAAVINPRYVVMSTAPGSGSGT